MDAAAHIPTGSPAGLVRSPRIPVLVAIAVAGCALAAVSIHLATDEGVEDIQVALLQWISIPYIAAGLIAWWRRPGSRLGPLMVAGGFTTGLLSLQFVEEDLLWTFGSTLDILPAAIFLHVSLAFPSGLLRSSAERALVGATYLVAVGLQVAKMMLADDLPQNALGVASRPDAAQLVERIQLLGVAAFCLTGVVLLMLRRREAGRPRRRWLALLVDCFAAGLVMLAVLYVAGAFDAPGSSRSSARPSWWSASGRSRSSSACSTRASPAAASATS